MPKGRVQTVRETPQHSCPFDSSTFQLFDPFNAPKEWFLRRTNRGSPKTCEAWMERFTLSVRLSLVTLLPELLGWALFARHFSESEQTAQWCWFYQLRKWQRARRQNR